jgi:ABC-type iron transport system FetAB permease component
MKHQTSFLHRLGNAIASTIVIGWILSWCFRSRVGMFLLLSILGWLTAVLVIGGTVNMISNLWLGFRYSLAGEGWFWLVCYLGSAIWTLDYLLTRERQIQAPVEDDED